MTALWGSACWGAAPPAHEAMAGSPAAAAAAAAAACERCDAGAQVHAPCPVPVSTAACLRGCWAERLPLPMPHDHPPALAAAHADRHLCRAAPQAAAHWARHSSGPTAADAGQVGERQVWHCSAGLRRSDFHASFGGGKPFSQAMRSILPMQPSTHSPCQATRVCAARAWSCKLHAAHTVPLAPRALQRHPPWPVWQHRRSRRCLQGWAAEQGMWCCGWARGAACVLASRLSSHRCWRRWPIQYVLPTLHA